MTEGTGLTAQQTLSINTVKVLSMDAVQAADSGHPGTPMALAPVGYELWTRHLRHNPANPDWSDRDRFVLSIGHASMLIYSLLYLTGYDLSLDDIKDFRQWGSKTPGHPEYKHTAGIETTTGPLGAGVSNSVGMAMAERWLASHFNKDGHTIVDHYTYALCSDGDLMEGISHEAAAIAGHQKLGKLIWIFDDNAITIEGATDLSTCTDQASRFEGYGWHTITVTDGADLGAIGSALEAARSETDRPTLIVLQTRIAEGSPNLVGLAAAHGAPMGREEIDATKKNIGYPSLEPFHVEESAIADWREAGPRGQQLEDEWNERFRAYSVAFPRLAAQYLAWMEGELPSDWDKDLPDLSGKKGATRGHSGAVLQSVAAAIPYLVGGSADLGGSNKTDINGAEDLLSSSPGGRVMHFGVREHAMGGIMNGMALHGGVRPFGGTFLIFSDYMRPSIRLASLMGLPVTYVFSHDSIGLGEDGPTHQPVEQLMTLRFIPGLQDLRPCDGPETKEAWAVAMEYTTGPSFLSLTRQSVAVIDRNEMAPASGLRKGGYVLAEAPNGDPEAIILASGSEVGLALEARNALALKGINARVVSMPSWYLFSQQSPKYRQEVLPSSVPHRVSVEAGSTLGWERWIGSEGASVGLDHFGASAPAEQLYAEFGITTEAVVRAVTELVSGA